MLGGSQVKVCARFGFSFLFNTLQIGFEAERKLLQVSGINTKACPFHGRQHWLKGQLNLAVEAIKLWQGSQFGLKLLRYLPGSIDIHATVSSHGLLADARDRFALRHQLIITLGIKAEIALGQFTEVMAALGVEYIASQHCIGHHAGEFEALLPQNQAVKLGILQQLRVGSRFDQGLEDG